MKRRQFSFHFSLPQPEFAFDWRAWLPSRGNVLFTLVMIAVLLWAQSAGAVPFLAESAASTGTIAYQGRLADSSGNPLTSTLNMSFRLYAASTGGTPLWTEDWTGSNGVKVSDGLFNVMLGSLTPIPQNVITGNANLFLGITVGTDDEMSPRVQLGTVPFAVQALSVPDGSITAAKLADDVSLVPPAGSITTTMIADGAITSAKLAGDGVALPFVPRVLKYVSKQNDLLLDSSPTGVPQTIETIDFSLPAPPTGYRWDLEWRFNQRLGSINGQSAGASFLLDGVAIKDSNGTLFAENVSLSIQFAPTDNLIMGGMVYQNNVSAGSHTISWQVAAYGDPSNKFLIRQRWLVLNAILVPVEF